MDVEDRSPRCREKKIIGTDAVRFLFFVFGVPGLRNEEEKKTKRSRAELLRFSFDLPTSPPYSAIHNIVHSWLRWLRRSQGFPFNHGFGGVANLILAAPLRGTLNVCFFE